METCPTRAILSYVDPTLLLPPFNTVKHNALCNHCEALNGTMIASPGGQPHAESIGALRHSSRVCPLCNLLYINSFGGISSPQDLPASGSAVCCLRLNGGISSMYLTFPGYSKQTRSGSLQLRVYTKEGDPAQHYGLNLLQSLTQSSSQRSVQWARRQIDECVKNHDCGQISKLSNNDMKVPFCPTRLVNVKVSDSGTESDVRLVSGAKAHEYITLSYCWGAHSATPWRTTTENLGSRHAGFGTHTLPQTLKDAITLTRKLGYYYLWVDALCIVQDSQKDWEEQSIQMGLIYSNSCVTIAATSSMNAEDGIFNSESVDQTRKISTAIEIPTQTTDGAQSILYAFQWTDSRGHKMQEESPRQLREGALSQRGWAYQERLFSPRTLHYTSEQLFWECRQCYLAEDGLYTQPFSTEHSQGITVSRGLRDLAFKGPPRVTFEIIEKWYGSVIPVYTERLLSRPKDKLPAVSALAKLIHEVTGAEYHAGLWLHTIQFGLCWMVTHPATRPVEYRSPSYSWAALDAEIYWPVLIFNYETPPPADFHVIAHEISSCSYDPFGTVEGGHLDLYGQLKPAIAVAVAAKTDDPLNYENAELWEKNKGGDCLKRMGGVYPPKVILDEPKIGYHVEVQCFLVCSTQPELPSNPYWESWMLLLQPTETKHSYRRVGIAALRTYDRAGWFDDSSRQRVRLT